MLTTAEAVSMFMSKGGQGVFGNTTGGPSISQSINQSIQKPSFNNSQPFIRKHEWASYTHIVKYRVSYEHFTTYIQISSVSDIPAQGL